MPGNPKIDSLSDSLERLSTIALETQGKIESLQTMMSALLTEGNATQHWSVISNMDTQVTQLQEHLNTVLDLQTRLSNQMGGINTAGGVGTAGYGPQNWDTVLSTERQVTREAETQQDLYRQIASEANAAANARMESLGFSPTGQSYTSGVLAYGPNQTGNGVASSGAAPTQAEIDAAMRAAEEESTVQVSAAEKRAAAQAAAAAEEQRILGIMQEQVATVDKYAALRKQAASAGYSNADITNIKQIGPSGVERVTYSQKAGTEDITGTINTANRQLDLFVTKTGQAIPAISRQFQTFGTAIARDFLELSKWTIAISLIYGPMREIQTLTTQLITNQTNLATSMIALVGTSTSVGDVFNIVATAANSMGEDVGATIDVFTQAYRASGSVTNQYDRLQTATKLMSDAMTLSKISGMAYNTAIDTLTASLRQEGMSLDEGTTLLDKWVAVGKVANVDLITLTSGFASLGDAAETAGMTTDELNGLLGTISETLGMTGTTAAWTARSFVSGFSNTKTEKALQAIGVSAYDTTGELRNLTDVMKEVADLQASGAISQDQLSAITLAWGGGTRRQAAVASVLANQSRMNEITAASANANGDAAGALATKLDTVQTALTRLTNSLQELAQTMGTKGGLLDTFTFILNIATKLVDVFNALSNAAGKAAPILTTLLLAYAVTRTTAGAGIGSGVGSFMTGLMSPNLSGVSSVRGMEDTALLEGVKMGGTQQPSSLATFMMGGGVGAGASWGGLASLLSAIPNFTQGNTQAGVGDIAGGVIGGALGGLVGGPMVALVGSQVGVAISEAFVKNVIQYKGEIGGAFAQAEANAKAQADIDAAKKGQTVAGSTAEQNFMAVQQQVLNYKNPSLGGFPAKLSNILTSWFDNQAQSFNNMLGRTDTTGSWTPEMVAIANGIPKDIYDQYVAAYNAMKVAEGNGTSPIGAFTQQQVALQNQMQATADKMQKDRQAQLLIQLGGGGATGLPGISTSQYTTSMGNIAGFNEQASRMFTAFGSEFEKNTVGINNMSDAYSAFLDILTQGSNEQLAPLTEMESEIGVVTSNLATNTLTMTINGESVTKTREEWEKFIADMKQLAGVTAASTLADIRYANLGQPSVVGGTTALSSTDFQKVQVESQTLRNQYEDYLRTTLGYTDNDIKTWESKLDNFVTLVDEAGKLIYQGGTGSQWFNNAESLLTSKGQITGRETVTNPSFQSIDLSSSMMNQILSGAATYSAKLSAAGYILKPEDVIAAFNDGTFAKIAHVDSTALALILQDLLNETKKQDQGMWNLPSGATFWVPITSLTAANKPQGGGLSSAGASTSTPTNTITSALDKLSADLSTYLMTPEELLGQQTAITNEKNSAIYNSIHGIPGVSVLSTDSSGSYPMGWKGTTAPLKEYFGNTAPPVVQSKINLDAQITTNLIVNGQILATVILPYIKQMLSQGFSSMITTYPGHNFGTP
jgi:TP901 family phage tail tape measure protein